MLERSAGGAEARPFLTFHNALGRSFALRIATGDALVHPAHEADLREPPCIRAVDA